MTKKFKVENGLLLPSDPNKSYGLPKGGIMITIGGDKRDGIYAESKVWKFKTMPIHGLPAKTDKEAIDTLLMWLENAVDDTTTEKDWN